MCFRAFPSGTMLWKTSLVFNYFHRIIQFIAISLKIVKVRVLKLLLNFKHSDIFISIHNNLKSQSKQFGSICPCVYKNNYTLFRCRLTVHFELYPDNCKLFFARHFRLVHSYSWPGVVPFLSYPQSIFSFHFSFGFPWRFKYLRSARSVDEWMTAWKVG
jgi:hypothetical protein